MLCQNCFGDEFLSEYIKSKSTYSILLCDHCRSARVSVIEYSDVADIASPILDLYAPSTDPDSLPLLTFLRKDWQILTGPADDRCNQILDGIFPEITPSTKQFKTLQTHTDSLTKWDDFQQELKHTNRFFPKTKIIDPDRLRFLFEFLKMKMTPEVYYRARICESDVAFSFDKMGKPPSKIAKSGRANPFGISYLYTASDSQTAIAEVRPHVGDKVTIATFRPHQSLSLLDLRNPRKSVSPFSLGDDVLLDYFNELDLLCRLGEKLSKPILPKESDLEYLASQYLSEMIKHFEYDGVVFKSSVGPGYNIAFFDDAKLQATTTVELYGVSQITYVSVRQ
jgi:hypothetical protein